MSLNSRDFISSPSNWFSPNIEYEGQGRAEFSDPQGFIEGIVKINFDEYGESSIDAG